MGHAESVLSGRHGRWLALKSRREKFDFTSKIKSAFSTNRARATGYPHAENEPKPILNTLYKN